MRNINEISVGEKVIYKVEITEKMHHDFTQISGDNSPIHTDKNFAQVNGYKDCIGYAFLLSTILSKIYGTIFPGGSELCLKQECNFTSPYFVHDELIFAVEVINKNEILRLLTVMTVVENQDGIGIFRGKAVFQLSLHI